MTALAEEIKAKTGVALSKYNGFATADDAAAAWASLYGQSSITENTGWSSFPATPAERFVLARTLLGRRFSSAIFYEQQIDEFCLLTHFGEAF